ncbi:uncharacterized protein LOC144139761 [Haemaphysalis longicornis]
MDKEEVLGGGLENKSVALLATLEQVRQGLNTSPSAVCLNQRAETISNEVNTNLRNAVKKQIGRCAYLSQAYNFSTNIACGKIVNSMNAFWASTFLFCLGYVMCLAVAHEVQAMQRPLVGTNEGNQSFDLGDPATRRRSSSVSEYSQRQLQAP